MQARTFSNFFYKFEVGIFRSLRGLSGCLGEQNPGQNDRPADELCG